MLTVGFRAAKVVADGGVYGLVCKENLADATTFKIPALLTDGADLAARHDHLHSLGIPADSIVDLEYHDYARSKYLALGMPDTMPLR